MIALKHVVMAAIVIASTLIAGASAQAFSARQASAAGQGNFVTSSGTPENMIPGSPVGQQTNSDRRPLRGDHHDRYFAGF
ncbi:hypothetical protein P7D22_19695 [Lichenihabitans sp. Uapishka_5]|uniref:hypothetical protein n=1 Tax=Lichenihabitans sp. Uapishka_5 TaxID=3037302 RepID=UPI0029E7FD70|nr:hypothetical protein [Lichenihabitans sp. Uapishka_5]MDX7953392.1 hypothetical protein [Lichenihabitans sp. Uapishka_5]